MYYHANVDIAGKNYLTFSNESEEFILKNVVVPFINGQVIESDHTYGKKKSILINMKSSTTLWKKYELIPERPGKRVNKMRHLQRNRTSFLHAKPDQARQNRGALQIVPRLHRRKAANACLNH